MASVVQGSSDWLRRPRTNLLAWWIPQAAMLAGLFIPVPVRTVVWIIALIWMGTACILNAGRCGRTHCRYTGAYNLAVIAPVLVLASRIVSADGGAGEGGFRSRLGRRCRLFFRSGGRAA